MSRHTKKSWSGCKKPRIMQFPGVTVRKAVEAGLMDDWSELMRSEELNP